MPLELADLRPVRSVLSNGLTLVAVPMPHMHRSVLEAQIRVGSRFERAEDNGISHFLEHMLYRGTSEHPSAHQLAVAFERVGGSLMATTSADTGTLEAVAPPQSMPAILPLFAAVLKDPALVDIDTERGIVREEILEGLDDDGKSIGSDDLIRGLMFPGHPLGQPISGTLTQLQTFDVAGLRAHHQRYYCGNNLVVAVAGPFDPNWALDALSEQLAPLPAGERPSSAPPAELQGPRVRRVMHRASQTEVTLAFRAPGFRAEDEAAMDLLSRILDDGMATRLYHQLCDERGLCYEVSGNYESYTDSGLLELFAETGHERVADVVEQLLAIVGDLKQRGPTTEELLTAKQRHRWQLEAMLDSPSHVAEYFLTEELLGTQRAPLERSSELLQVERDAVVAVARRWFSRESLCLLLLGYPKRGATARVDRLVGEFS